MALKTELIREENYSTTMKETVEPWLAERRTVLWACRETGQRIYCERYLTEEARGAVLISHGFKESAVKFAEAVWYFLHEGYHVYLLEHCGHGRSYRLVDDLSLVHVDNHLRYIGDLLAVARMARKDIDRLADGTTLPLYLFGHSMGGGIALAAAAREPALFQKLVLSAPMIRVRTDPFPYGFTVVGSATLCALGMGENYCPGHHPYQGKEDYAESVTTSRARFDYYQKIKATNPLLQMSAASIGWLRAATQLEMELMNRSVREGHVPALVFRAVQDKAVDIEAQERYVRERNKWHPGSTDLRCIPGTKHEIYNSPDAVVRVFWEEVFDFLR